MTKTIPIQEEDLEKYMHYFVVLKEARIILNNIISPLHLGELWHSQLCHSRGALDTAITELDRALRTKKLKMDKYWEVGE